MTKKYDTTKLKPFNLERALDGDPVCNGRGEPVTELKKFYSLACEQKLVGIVNGCMLGYGDDGRYFSDGKITYDDLFMAPKTVKKYANVYRNPETGQFWFSPAFNTQDGAENERLKTQNRTDWPFDVAPAKFIATVSFECEE